MDVVDVRVTQCAPVRGQMTPCDERGGNVSDSSGKQRRQRVLPDSCYGDGKRCRRDDRAADEYFDVDAGKALAQMVGTVEQVRGQEDEAREDQPAPSGL